MASDWDVLQFLDIPWFVPDITADPQLLVQSLEHREAFCEADLREVWGKIVWHMAAGVPVHRAEHHLDGLPRSFVCSEILTDGTVAIMFSRAELASLNTCWP